MRSSFNTDYQVFKIVLLGAPSCGKTSLVNRFAHDRFSANSESTIGAIFLSKIINIDGQKPIKIEIWDTGGSEKYRSLAAMYYRDAHAALLVCDLTSSQSLNDAAVWLGELKEKGPESVVIALAANKSDLVEARVLKELQIFEFAGSNNISLFKETSALSGNNVQELFTGIAMELITRASLNTQTHSKAESLELTAQVNSTPKKCC